MSQKALNKKTKINKMLLKKMFVLALSIFILVTATVAQQCGLSQNLDNVEANHDRVCF